MLMVVPLSAARMPGTTFADDVEWAVAPAVARPRCCAINRRVSIRGFPLDVCVIDRIGSLIGHWPEPDGPRRSRAMSRDTSVRAAMAGAEESSCVVVVATAPSRSAWG